MKYLTENMHWRTWNFMRVFRLAVGLMVVYMGYTDKDWLIAGLGGLFVLQGLLNAGCAGGACNVNTK